jgi:hypothetical protein
MLRILESTTRYRERMLWALESTIRYKDSLLRILESTSQIQDSLKMALWYTVPSCAEKSWLCSPPPGKRATGAQT